MTILLDTLQSDIARSSILAPFGARANGGEMFPTSGADMASRMGFANAPNMLTRLNGTSGLPDLAGGDDAFDAYNAGISTSIDPVLGVCADRNDNSGYYCRYAATSKFDLTTESFAFNIIYRYHNVATTRYLFGKFNTTGWILLSNPGGSITLNVYGSSTVGRTVMVSDNIVVVVTGVCDRNANTVALHANALTSGTTAPPAGSLTNTGRFSLGGVVAGALTPESEIALVAFWQGANAEGITQTHHNNLRASMGL